MQLNHIVKFSTKGAFLRWFLLVYAAAFSGRGQANAIKLAANQ